MINYFREVIEPSESTEELIANNEPLAAQLEKYAQEQQKRSESFAKAFSFALDYAQGVTGKPREVVFLEIVEFLTRYAGKSKPHTNTKKARCLKDNGLL